MRTATEFYGEGVIKRPDRINGNYVGIGNAEFMLGAEFLRFRLFHIGTNDGNGLGNFLVYNLFHVGLLFRRHLLSVGEVDAQALTGDVRTALMYLRTELHLERF